jgi:hypothetical protein
MDGTRYSYHISPIPYISHAYEDLFTQERIKAQ